MTIVFVQTGLCAPVYQLEELCSFPPASNESGPRAGVIFGDDGALYGTTYAGGDYGYGSVFRVTTNGALTTLVSFGNTNGANPYSGLLLGNDGSFYGTTAFGGSRNAGTLFRMTVNGEFTTLVHFDGTNGYAPKADMVQGADGALYGTTGGGGFAQWGNVFRFSTNGVLTTIAEFSGANGNRPNSNLILAEDGSIYGTTYYGGYSNAYPNFGPGNVFRISPGGVITNLVTFAYTNGAQPIGELVYGADGALYGATETGGYAGKVFRVTTNGLLSVVASFDPFFGDPLSGSGPRGGLAPGGDGAFYGTTLRGGDFASGTVFRVTMAGLGRTLVSFAGTNGTNPRGALIQGSDGAFYGTTPKGGSLGGGNVFRIQVFSHIESVNHVGSAWQVAIRGVEGESYQLERSTNLAGPWLTLTNFTMDATQRRVVLDPNAPASSAYYRTVTP